MPDISNQLSYLQQLQDVRNPNSTMGALDRLGSSIGNAWQGYEAGADQQALTKFFMENPVSPETIQAFSASHPRMPQMEIFKGAGMIAAQKKAQTIKDASKTYANFWIKNIKEGKIPTPQEESAILETMDPEARDFIFKNREQWMKSYGPEFKEVAAHSRLVKMKSPLGGEPEVVIDAVSAVKEKTDADRAVQILMKKTNPDTNLPYTEDEAYIKIHHPVTPKEAKEPVETWGDPYEMQIGGKKALVRKSSRGKVEPVIQDTSTTTTVNLQTPSTEETEVVAQLLADGKITMSDISKRGGVKQQAAILKRASEINPSIDPRAAAAETSAFAGSIGFQQKQAGAMGSFVRNMDMQVEKVKELANDLKTFDSRIMNVPLRAFRSKIAGSPLQAKYDMYITEIENEIGKLATGSAASVAELTQGAQEKWAKIHDKNLSVKDMISLLEETSRAGKMRLKSVEDQIRETKTQMRGRGGAIPAPGKTVVERRASKNRPGVTLIKYSDGTLGEE